MSAGTANITIEQGIDFVKEIFWKYKADDSPVDLSGYSARMQIRPSHDSIILIANLTSEPGGGLEIDAPNGKITINIPAEKTQNFTITQGVYDLELQSASGKVTRLLKGNYTLSLEVTR